MNPHANIVQRDRNNATALAKAIVASAGTPIYNSCDAGALRIQIAAAILDSVTTARAEAARAHTDAVMKAQEKQQ